jgi:hypothetical protein
MIGKYSKKKQVTAEKQKFINLWIPPRTILTEFRASLSWKLIEIELMKMPTKGIGNRENFS